MPRPRSLTLTAIADAALEVIDREGLAALSMRAVAGALGVGAMSLYRYVASREELEDLVVGRVLGGVELEHGGDWKERVRALLEAARDAVRAHPEVVPLLLTRRHASEASLRFGEAMLAALAEGGFEGIERAIAFRTLLSFLLGAVQAEHFGPLAGAGTATLAELPAAHFPHLVETANAARRVEPDEELRRGLDIVLAGLDVARTKRRR